MDKSTDNKSKLEKTRSSVLPYGLSKEFYWDKLQIKNASKMILTAADIWHLTIKPVLSCKKVISRKL